MTVSKEKELISIIVATYNSAATVADTLDSIRSQTYQNWEVILQDGGSTDETIAIAESLVDARIQIHQEKDTGLYDAMNKGISKTKGGIVGILNSDDVYAHTEVLSQIGSAFAEDEALDTVYANLEYVDQTLTKVLRYWKSRPFRRSLLYSAWQPPHPTVYLRRRVYTEVGQFNTKYRIAADFDLMFRVFFLAKRTSTYVDDTFVKMRIGGESNRSWKNRWTLIKEYQAIYSASGHKGIGPFSIMARLSSRLIQFKVK